MDEVEREIPIFSRDSRYVRLERGLTIRYHLQSDGVKDLAWKLLQRSGCDPQTPDVPEGWRLFVEGSLPTRLRQVLLEIAHEWKEDYLEFEGHPSGIDAYWEEWGGARGVRKIADYLHRISSVSR